MKRSSRDGRIGGCFITLIVLACVAFGIVYFLRNLKVVEHHRGSGDDVSIDTPAGRIEIRSQKDVDPAALGIPVYPGATRTKDGGGATFSWTSRDGNVDKGLSVTGGELSTPDPASKVLDYYRTQLPNWIVRENKDGSTQFELKEGGYRRIVVVHEKSDGTHIGIANIGEPASN
ncbi:MAG: hypothetical protein KGN84_13130 [Acidobacteriota bacterium]|nr:hypothetical protein [Acidobacteriota bacterium]